MPLYAVNLNFINYRKLRQLICLVVLAAFTTTTLWNPAYAKEDPVPFLPAPGTMVNLSPAFSPAYLRGIVIHPENPFKFDFIINKGDQALSDAQKRDEYTKLTKYFLAALAIPDDDQWVNLSPYEKDRIIKDDFGKTEMGRDLLAQDYMLKQITASLIYPESHLGKEFWNKVYSQAQKQYGTSNIPVNTFNKVWILPDSALIYEKGNTAYILKNHLRVMLEEDYLSLQKHNGINRHSERSEESKGALRSFVTKIVPQDDRTHALASNIIKPNPSILEFTEQRRVSSLAKRILRAIILPELQREVNEDKNFALLRQVYSGMLLATWFKRELKQSLLGQIYANKNKIKGLGYTPMPTRGHGFSLVPKPLAKQESIEGESTPGKSPNDIEYIYQQYLKAYKKGVFNFIKEDVDMYTKETLPRKYFSGGTGNFAMAARVFGGNIVNTTHDPAQLPSIRAQLMGDDLVAEAFSASRQKTGDRAQALLRDQEQEGQLQRLFDQQYSTGQVASRSVWERPQFIMDHEIAQVVGDRVPSTVKVLNLGAGDGAGGSMYLVAQGFQTIQTDISAVAIGKFREALTQHGTPQEVERTQFRVGDMEEVLKSLPSQSVDIVHAHLSLQYFSYAKTLRIFQQIHRVLLPGGSLILKVFSAEDSRLQAGTLRPLEDEGHPNFYEAIQEDNKPIRLFTRADLVSFLEQGGFSEYQIKQISVPGWKTNKPWVVVAKDAAMLNEGTVKRNIQVAMDNMFEGLKFMSGNLRLDNPYRISELDALLNQAYRAISRAEETLRRIERAIFSSSSMNRPSITVDLNQFAGDFNTYLNKVDQINQDDHFVRLAYKWPDRFEDDYDLVSTNFKKFQSELQTLAGILANQKAHVKPAEREKTEEKPAKPAPTQLEAKFPNKAEYIQVQEWVQKVVLPPLYTAGILSEEPLFKVHLNSILNFAIENALLIARQADPNGKFVLVADWKDPLATTLQIENESLFPLPDIVINNNQSFDKDSKIIVVPDEQRNFVTGTRGRGIPNILYSLTQLLPSSSQGKATVQWSQKQEENHRWKITFTLRIPSQHNTPAMKADNAAMGVIPNQLRIPAAFVKGYLGDAYKKRISALKYSVFVSLISYFMVPIQIMLYFMGFEGMIYFVGFLNNVDPEKMLLSRVLLTFTDWAWKVAPFLFLIFEYFHLKSIVSKNYLRIYLKNFNETYSVRAIVEQYLDDKDQASRYRGNRFNKLMYNLRQSDSHLLRAYTIAANGDLIVYLRRDPKFRQAWAPYVYPLAHYIYPLEDWGKQVTVKKISPKRRKLAILEPNTSAVLHRSGIDMAMRSSNANFDNREMRHMMDAAHMETEDVYQANRGQWFGDIENQIRLAVQGQANVVFDDSNWGGHLFRGPDDSWWLHLHNVDRADTGIMFQLLLKNGEISGLSNPMVEVGGIYEFLDLREIDPKGDWQEWFIKNGMRFLSVKVDAKKHLETLIAQDAPVERLHFAVYPYKLAGKVAITPTFINSKVRITILRKRELVAGTKTGIVYDVADGAMSASRKTDAAMMSSIKDLIEAIKKIPPSSLDEFVAANQSTINELDKALIEGMKQIQEMSPEDEGRVIYLINQAGYTHEAFELAVRQLLDSMTKNHQPGYLKYINWVKINPLIPVLSVECLFMIILYVLQNGRALDMVTLQQIGSSAFGLAALGMSYRYLRLFFPAVKQDIHDSLVDDARQMARAFVNNRRAGYIVHARSPEAAADVLKQEISAWISAQKRYKLGVKNKTDQILKLIRLYHEENTDQYLIEFGNPAMKDQSLPSIDHASVTKGGIDFNSANLAMTIKRDGHGTPLPWKQQDLAQLSPIDGLDPIILSIKPASQAALFN